MPAGFDERARQEAEEEGGQGEAWASELTLVLPGLGELAVQLRLVARRLNLTLDSPEAGVVSRLEAGLPRLARRLEALGFEARLAARHRPEEGT
nr:flagellar hook-length control protein FliK [Halomonas pacifica]